MKKEKNAGMRQRQEDGRTEKKGRNKIETKRERLKINVETRSALSEIKQWWADVKAVIYDVGAKV